jgi:hypothetical protein
MGTARTFQRPSVNPLLDGPRDSCPSTVHLRVAPADARRILRALDEVSLNLACTPSGSRVATAYRCLAADLRMQTSVAHTPAGDCSERGASTG